MRFHTPLSPIIYAKLLGSKLAGEYQPKITATGMLKGNGNGNVSAAFAGTDYDTASNIVSATATMTLEQAAQTRQNIGADGINNHVEQVSVTYGSELATGTWTDTGWTAITGGYQHNTGNNTHLSLAIPTLSAGSLYRLDFTATDLDINGRSDFYVSLGNSPIFETYKGGGASQNFSYILITGNDSGKLLEFIPYNTWTGTITNISIKEITSHSITKVIAITDDNGDVVLEARVADNNSIFIGEDAGENAISASLNVGIGYKVLAKLTDGFWNTGIGAYALSEVVNGSRNIAMGYTALKELNSGDRNIAIGTFAQRENVSGRNNIAIGADALQFNKSGYENLAVGTGTGTNLMGSRNVLLGYLTLHLAQDVNDNIAIGYCAMQNATAGNNIGVGMEALRDRSGVGTKNVAIGHLAGKLGTTGHNNCYIGYGAGLYNTGSNNVIIGHLAATPNNSDSNTIVLGNADSQTVIIANKRVKFNSDGTVTWEAL